MHRKNEGVYRLSKYCWTTSAICMNVYYFYVYTSAGALSVIGGYFIWGITARGMMFVRYSEVRGVRYTEVRNVWSACGCHQGAQSLSVVGRLSALRSVHYRRFHCIPSLFLQ